MERPAVILALALSPSLDVTYEVASLRRGRITRPRAVTRVAGGKALNLARVAAALAAEVRVVVALGGHSGAWVAEMLRSDGVEASVVPLSAPTRTCAAIVEDEGGTSSTDLYEPATAFSPDEWERFRDAASSAAPKRPSWVVVSGSVPDGVPLDALASLVSGLRSQNARIAVDSSGAGLRALAGHADLLKLNRSEAAELLGGEQPDAPTAARALRALFGCDIVVTDGVRGGHAIIADDERGFAAPDTPGRYPAGSGDAFLGGLLAALDTGRDTDAAIALAREAAERNAAIPGQGLLGASDVRG